MKKLMLLALLFVSNSSSATEDLFGMWGSVYVNGNITKGSNFFYYMDVSLRPTESNPDSNGNQHFTLGSVVTHDGIGYKINNNHSILFGYAYNYSQPPYYGGYLHEQRIFQQYGYNRPTSWGNLAYRMRLEERIAESSASTAIRNRHQLKFRYDFDKDWSWVTSNEVFFNFNSVNWGPYSGFDQNRFFTGIGYNINPSLRFEGGYMNQYVNREFKEDLVDNQLSLNMYINVPD